MNKSLSQFSNIECRVPQGSVLSPILFALYFDAVTNFTSGTNKVKIALFADDVVIWCTHWNKASVQANIQKVTTAFNNECSQLGLEINLKKTTYTLFARNGNRRDFQPKSSLNI